LSRRNFSSAAQARDVANVAHEDQADLYSNESADVPMNELHYVAI